MVSHALLDRPPPVNIRINNTAINRVNKVMFLGVLIDSTLKWKPHIDDIKTKVSKFIGVIYKLRNCLNQESIKIIYFSLVYPNLFYCSAIWGGAYHTYIQSLFTTQKKLLRVMFHCNRYDHTNPYFAQHKLLKLPDIITLQTCLFVYSTIKNNYSGTEYHIISHNTATRRLHMLRLPLCRTSHSQQSVLVRGARQWNSLSDHLRLAPSRHCFKYRLKQTLLTTYNCL